MLEIPHYYEHHTITYNPLLQTPHYYGQTTIMDTTLCTDTRLLRTPHYYGHPAVTDAPLLRTPGYFGQPAVTGSPLLWTPQYYGNLTITDTPHHAQEKTCDENNFKKLLRIPAVKAAKHEIQKPSTCRATLFRCKFSSMFLVFHLV